MGLLALLSFYKLLVIMASTCSFCLIILHLRLEFGPKCSFLCLSLYFSKDGELEERLLPLLKKILHERGQQSINDLRVYIDSLEENGESGNTGEAAG